MARTSVAKPAAPIRTAILRVTIGSFSLAALLGVIALLGGGAFSETEARILNTTLLVGVGSVMVLCYLATAGTAYQPVGIAGGAVVVVPLACALFVIWADYEVEPPEALVKTFGVGAVVAVTLAQACLLLGPAARARRTIRRIMWTTVVLATVLAGMVSALVLGLEPRNAYWRLLGVVAILDVLGTVVVAAVTRFGTRAPAPASLSLPPELVRRVVTEAERTGRAPEDVVGEALDRYLAGADDR
jgi:hypothetical protein